MDKRDIRRGLLGAVIVAQLAVLDYCAIQLMQNRVFVEVSDEDREGE